MAVPIGERSMAETVLSIRAARIWGRACRAYIASSKDSWIRSLPDGDRAFLERALNAFVQVPKGADERMTRMIEKSRDRIRANELSGEEPLDADWFEHAAARVVDVDAVYEALYDWHLAVKEYLDQVEPTLTRVEVASLKRVLPALLPSCDRTADLDCEAISGALLDELGQDKDFDVYFWIGTAMERLDDVIAYFDDVRISDMRTLPPVDPLHDGPEVTVQVDPLPTVAIPSEPPVPPPKPSVDPVHTVKIDPLTGQPFDHFDLDQD